jgi:6-phosphogluconolactonase
MSLLRAARAARFGQERRRGILAAIAVFFLAALFVSCGGGHSSQLAPSHNAYVTLPTAGAVLLLHIDGSTGAITKGTRTPQVAGTSPNGLALLPSKKFLYVANAQANTISIFSVAGDGTLSLSGTPTPAGAGPHAAVIDPSGKYLLVTNSFSDNLSVFSIDSTSGALQEVAGSPFYANNSPAEILIVPAGNLVYVTNPTIGMVTAFTFDSSTGALGPVPGSPFLSGAGASGLTTDNNGVETHLYVANSSADNPGSTTIGNISAFNIDSTTGALSAVLGSPFTSTVGTSPSALVVDPSGHFLYATTPGSSDSIWCFTIDPNNGQLTAVTNSPFSLSAGGLFALIDTSGNFFYIGSQSSTGVAGYTFDSNTGAPTAIVGSPFSTGTAPGKMVISH